MNQNTQGDIFHNKTILITGGTGSFGQKFAKFVLEHYRPFSVRIFSRDEFKQFQMQQNFKDERINFFVGDVRDKERLSRAMNGVDIVVHTAALKQVPSCEYNPFEAVKTNIFGAQNVIEAAIDNNVEKVINLSTDKSVNPVNLYGATKLCAEKLFVQGNSYVGKNRRTKISCVRYGNVMASRGSVIPFFLEQKKTGVLTVTDARMTRFWITLDEAVKFVSASLEAMNGGEVFVPKIPSMKIIDLAQVIAPKAKIKIVGIRPGEKLHEMLLQSDEARHSKEFNNYFVIEPEFDFWSRGCLNGGAPLPQGFNFASDTNKRWLTKEELAGILKNFELK